MITYNTLIVLAGVGLLGIGAGIIGSFAVLRKRALLGDALAHAALPGLCLGFLVLQERDLTAMLLGALATGFLGIAVVSVLVRWTRVRQDAAIGIVLSVFFGAGIVLSGAIQRAAVAGSKAGLESYILGKTAGIIASDVVVIAFASAACVGLVAWLYKEFLLVSFDLEFAVVQGWPARRIDLILTTLIAIIVVVGLPTVGVVMIAALLIIPGATARFWADRLGRLVLLAAAFGAAMGLVGTLLSAAFEKMPAGPIITLVGTGLFLISAVAAPRRGIISRLFVRRQERWRRDYDEMLRVLYEPRQTKANDGSQRIESAEPWSKRRMHKLLAAGMATGEVSFDEGEGYRLTSEGEVRALDAVRRNRLWKMMVTEYPDLVPLANPLSSDSVEATIPGDVVKDLTNKLAAAGQWPTAQLAPATCATEVRP